jgi:hypothetical protein
MVSNDGLFISKTKLKWNVPIYKYLISVHKLMFSYASGM